MSVSTAYTTGNDGVAGVVNLFKGLWDHTKGSPSSCSIGNLAHFFPVPITGPPKMSKSWLIRGAPQSLGKMKEETGGEKRGPMNSVNYLPHWPRSWITLGKGRPTYT